ncbi:MAG: hypothetical protein LBM77_02985 [Spirochaetaceae bacterium]|jgi:DNA-binding NarL/FixJ family response regulator|nr:hypothetical protein [Spirochaetaceae bacterium]
MIINGKITYAIIATKSPFFCETIKGFIHETDVNVELNTATGHKELNGLLEQRKPKYLIVEDSFQGCSTSLLVRKLSNKYSGMRIVVFTAKDDEVGELKRFRNFGAYGYIEIRKAKAFNVKIIQDLLKGKKGFCAEWGECFIEKYDANAATVKEQFNLTDTEWAVIQEKLARKTKPQIAECFGKHFSTVNTQMDSIYKKIGAHDTWEFIGWAATFKLITLDDLTRQFQHLRKPECYEREAA